MMSCNCSELCIVLLIATQSTNDSIPVGASRPAGVPVPGQSTRGGERPQPPAVGDPDYLPPGGPDGVQEGQGDNAANSN